MGILKGGLIFVAGAAVGAIGSYIKLKTVFDRVFEEQKQILREEAIKEHTTPNKAAYTKAVDISDKEDLPFENDGKVQHEYVNYTQYSTNVNKKEKAMNNIERIDFDQFNERNGYAKRIMTYDEDTQVFLDVDDEIIEEDILSLIGGEENLDYIGEYEERTLYVRNHEAQTDFEICVDFNVRERY